MTVASVLSRGGATVVPRTRQGCSDERRPAQSLLPVTTWQRALPERLGRTRLRGRYAWWHPVRARLLCRGRDCYPVQALAWRRRSAETEALRPLLRLRGGGATK